MDGVPLPQGYSHFEKAVYFLPLSSQKFLVLILSTLEGWKAESTLKPPSGFEHGTPGLGIQHLNHLAIALTSNLEPKIYSELCQDIFWHIENTMECLHIENPTIFRILFI